MYLCCWRATGDLLEESTVNSSTRSKDVAVKHFNSYMLFQEADMQQCHTVVGVRVVVSDVEVERMFLQRMCDNQ